MPSTPFRLARAAAILALAAGAATVVAQSNSPSRRRKAPSLSFAGGARPGESGAASRRSRACGTSPRCSMWLGPPAASSKRRTAATFSPIFDLQPVASIGGSRSRPQRERHLAGTGEGTRATAFVRQRRLPLDQCGTELDARRPRRQRAHQADRRASAESGCRLRLRARPRVGPERGARRLPHDERGPVLAEGALQEPGHGLLRHRDGSVRSAHAVRGHVHVPPQAVAVRQRRRGDRALQVDRRRRHVAKTHQRPAHRADGSARRRDRGQQPERRT